MSEDIKKIIWDGHLAPSGENCQPWKFSASSDTIRVYNVPEADQSIYNFAQLGSYVAHGALIENIVISARHYGYEPRVKMFPDAKESNLIAVVTLSPATPAGDPLYDSLSKRATNRKAHRAEKIPASAKQALASAAKEAGAELKIMDDPERMGSLGQALSVNEEVLFGNKALHDFFYSHLLWNKDDQREQSGFYWETLEFLPKQLPAIKLLRSWAILRTLNAVVKVSRQIAKENAEKYADSGALMAILVSGESPEDYVRAGRAAERAWLTATKLGLSVHPCTGTLFFMENIRRGNGEVFSPQHQQLIKGAYATIRDTFEAADKTMPMLMRLGYAEAPTATAMRMEPVILEQ